MLWIGDKPVYKLVINNKYISSLYIGSKLIWRSISKYWKRKEKWKRNQKW